MKKPTRFRYRSLSSEEEETAEEQEQIRLVGNPELDVPTMSPFQPVLTTTTPRIRIDRPVLNQLVLYPKFDPRPNSHSLRQRSLRQGVSALAKSKCDPLLILYTLIPIFDWLPKYEWKANLFGDLIAGFTIAVMHIPQGMAYALLGNLPPIVGIYMAFFPVIIYSCLGTSRQVSMGTFAVICLMTGKVAVDRLTLELSARNSTDMDGPPRDIDDYLQEEAIKQRLIEIATAISLVVGLWQVLMGILQLGAFSRLLSTELVSGFTTGAAVHVFTSQMKNLLGIPIGRRSGIGKIIWTYIDIGRNVTKTNLMALLLSVITISILLIYNEVLKPIIGKKLPFPIPIELLTIILGTVVSFYTNLERNYNISIVSTIPTGLPYPNLAPVDVLGGILVDGLVISIVAYAISISMCKIFATKHNYTIGPNQELFAQGMSNIFGSFFSCAPIAASLSRSVIQDSVGGKTQLAGLFSSTLLIFVLLWIGPFFETLPNCILSGIIVVALKGMFLQFSDLKNAWKVSKLSASVWVVSFLATALMDIEYGLAIGILCSILILLWTVTHGSLTVLGRIPESELYTDVSANIHAKEMRGIKILKYNGTLNFVNGEQFVHQVEKCVTVKQAETQHLEKISINTTTNGRGERRESTSSTKYGPPPPLNYEIEWIILDFSAVGSVDCGSLRPLQALFGRLVKHDVQLLFAGCSRSVLEVMETTCFLTEIGIPRFFPSTHDAVIHVLNLRGETRSHHLRP